MQQRVLAEQELAESEAEENEEFEGEGFEEAEQESNSQTATGRSVSRADTIAYRARAFTQQGSPAKQGVQVVDDHNVLIMAAVQTARGRVNRSSLWHYDTAAAPKSWRLRFRQETTAS